MAYNGSGSFSPDSAYFPAVSGALIESAKYNGTINDLATGLSTALTKDGQTTVSANLPMAGYRHTGVGNASTRTDYAAAGQAQDSSFLWAGTATGTANAIALTLAPAITAYAAGQSFTYKSSASANTTAMTVAVSGLTTKAIQKNGAAVASGDHPANMWFRITYDGAAFQLEQIALVSTIGAPLASPTFTGTPAAPTAAVSTSTTQLATTAFVMAQTATTARSGHLETATDAEAQAGTDAAKIVTPDNLGATVIGIGQTWQNMNASRAGNITYTNSTGRPIMVSASLITSAACTMQYYNSGVLGTGSSYYVTGGTTYASFIVPNGGTYSCVNNVGTSVVGEWMELR